MQSLEKTNILDFELSELEDLVLSLGEKRFRAKQIFSWLSKFVSSFEEMNNIPNELRSKLDKEFYISMPEVIIRQESKVDGTIKCLYEFSDGARVESVFMKYGYGNSICISSQVGCRMGCKFCASTINGLERCLTAGEMLAEVYKMCSITGEKISHIVVMGMGEPFDNYGEVSKFIKLIHSPDGYDLSLRNITVSTCGIIPAIEKFQDDFPQVNLAISLHAPNQEIREKIMPIANKYKYDDLLKTCKVYTEKTKRRISFEYSMIDGVNDSTQYAMELANKLSGWLTHVNLIPLNEVKERKFNTAKKTNIANFKKVLEDKGITVTVRRTLGADIDAACGQLRQR